MKYFYPYFVARRGFSILFCSLVFVVLCTTVAQSQEASGAPAQSQEARDAFKLGVACAEIDYDCKIINYTKAIELDNTYFQAYYNRGLVYRKKGRDDLAIADFNKAIELKPDYALAYNSRGIVYGETRKLDLALADFNKALELNPGFIEGYNNRGLVYYRLRSYDLAIAEYDKAIELYGDSPNAFLPYANRGIVYNSKRNINQAIADCTKAIQLNPDYAQAYVERGMAYDTKGSLDLALADYNKAIQLKPDYAKTYNGRGWVYHQRRMFDRAIADYTTAIRLKPDYATPYCNRGYAYADIGNYDQAIADYTKSLELEPDMNYEIYRSRALAWFYKNDGEKAYRDSALYLKLNGLKGDAAPYGIMVGYMGLRKTGNTALAGTFLKDWLKKLQPGDWSTQILKYFDGQMTAEQLLALANDNDKQTEAHAYIGEMLLFENKKKEAFEHFYWVRDNGNKTFIEYIFSLEELKR